MVRNYGGFLLIFLMFQERCFPMYSYNHIPFSISKVYASIDIIFPYELYKNSNINKLSY